jgi:hypothetical protein
VISHRPEANHCVLAPRRGEPAPCSVLEGPRSRPDRAHPGGGRRRRSAVRAAARQPWRGLGGVGMAMLATTTTSVLGGGRLLRSLLDRPPHDHDQRDQWDLEGEHEPHESPGHGMDRTHRAPKIHAQSSRDVSAISVLARGGARRRVEGPSGGADACPRRLAYAPPGRAMPAPNGLMRRPDGRMPAPRGPCAHPGGPCPRPTSLSPPRSTAADAPLSCLLGARHLSF